METLVTLRAPQLLHGMVDDKLVTERAALVYGVLHYGATYTIDLVHDFQGTLPEADVLAALAELRLLGIIEDTRSGFRFEAATVRLKGAVCAVYPKRARL